MVNAQEWLDQKYPLENRNNIKELDISNKNLEGNLDLSDFTSLSELNCSNNKLTNLKFSDEKKLTKLDINEEPQSEELVEVIKNSQFKEIKSKAQQWLESQVKYDNQEKRKQITKLYISSKKLIGNLDLSSFTNLRELYCFNNQLTKLNISSCQQLTRIECYDNYLTSFDYSALNPQCLIWLNISDNNLPEKDLSVFSQLVNLESLWIGGDNQEHFTNSIYNKFVGSLAPLQSLTKLRDLYISNTDLAAGLEHLPSSMQVIYCSSEERPSSKVQAIEVLLSNSSDFVEKDDEYGKYYEKKFIVQDYIKQNYSDKENTKQIKFDSTKLEFEQTGKLMLTDYPNLEKIEARGSDNIKNITAITITNCPHLTELLCANNQLTNLDFLADLNPLLLKKLVLWNNNFSSQNLVIFTPFLQLKLLSIAVNKFTGSLTPLRKLDKLETLYISDTDISHGLEHLSYSVTKIYCDPMRPNAKVNDIYQELQPFGGDINKWREVKMEKKPYLQVAPLMPAQLLSENKWEVKIRTYKNNFFNFIGGNKFFKDFDYNELHFNQWKINEPLAPQEAPTKLYDTNKDKVIPAHDNQEPYAILSYVWGERGTKAMATSSTKRDQGQKEISNSAQKAINKATSALEVINQELVNNPINYLWVDQLCMNQEDQHEKSLEVPKMGKYYDNATLTLIDMNAELGDLNNIDLMDMLRLITNSEWFSRSWTYQEGWLSKHTIFMFDDKLIDGRAMAGTWALNQLSYIEGGKYNSRSEFDRGTKKIATPVGWVYYREGYDANKDKVELTLTQALQAIKHRQRTVDLDGIYSILGLLPYGQQVPVSYSESNTSEQALKAVMEVAINNGYAEPLAWHGASNETAGLCCLPQIDENGSTSIQGSVGKINSIMHENNEKYELISLTDQGLEFAWEMPHYVIQTEKESSNIHKLESGLEIAGGLYQKNITVKARDTEEKPFQLSLLGTQATLNLATANKILVVLYKEHYGTNKLFACLVNKTEQADVYHRLGLVELANSEGIKFSAKKRYFDKKTLIGANHDQPHYQAQTEQLPK